MTNAGSEENKERKDWRYVCQDCDFVTMGVNYASDHEDAERHTNNAQSTVQREGSRVRLVAISDTHTLHNSLVLPEGDVLIHAGDGTSSGNMEQTKNWAAWMREQAKRFKYVVVIGGNHDFSLEHFMREGCEELVHEMFYPAYYLRDESLHIEGKNFYGSPWQPRFFDWAFNADRGPDIAQHWAKIPQGTDVLITHGPPMGILDWVGKERVGCADLRVVVEDIQPQVHIFGHIHGGYGVQKQNGTEYYNAALLNDAYTHPWYRKPWVIDL